MQKISAEMPGETWRWEIELKDGDAYVRESLDGALGYVEFGPMHRDAVGPFVDERREFLETQAPLRQQIRVNRGGG